MQAIKRTFGFINTHPIAKRNRFLAYYRLFWWQLLSRFQKNKLHEIPFVGETKFFAKRNLTGITGSIYTGIQDFEEMSFLLHFLRQSDCFFDVGANVGAYSILASGVKRCQSVAFEPNTATFQLLKKNIELNKLGNLVSCENKGIGSRRGKLKFTANQDTTNHVISTFDAELPFIEVEVVPLDDYIGKYHPTLIKIDVEGFETEVINGSKAILEIETLKAIIIELNGSGGRYGYNEQLIHNKLLEHSFHPFTYDPFQRTLISQESYGKFNTIYIRNYGFVIERLKNSEQYQVWNLKI